MELPAGDVNLEEYFFLAEELRDGVQFLGRDTRRVRHEGVVCHSALRPTHSPGSTVRIDSHCWLPNITTTSLQL